MSRLTSIACLPLMLSLACSGDLSAPGSGFGATTGSVDTTASGGTTGAVDTTAAESTSAGSETGAADSGSSGDPPADNALDCSLHHAPLSGVVVVDDPPIPVSVSACDDLENAPLNNGLDYEVLVFRPGQPGTEAWPPGLGERPWIVLQHGNSQGAEFYDHIVSPLVERGFVVFVPTDGNVPFASDPPPWEHRRDNILCSLRAITETYVDDDELGECFGLIGHSNGGAGAAGVAVELVITADPLASRLGAIAALAPAGFQNVPGFNAELNPALLVLVGSHDEDTGLGGSNLYQHLAHEGALDLAAPISGSQPGRVGEKVLVEAFDASHNSLGGTDFFFPKGEAIASAYVPAFFFWQFFADDSLRPRFADNEIPAGLDVAEWWNDLDQWDGTPLIYSSYQMGDRRGIGIQRYVIDTFEGDNSSDDLDYAGEGSRLPSMLETQEEIQRELYAAEGLDSTQFNRALRVDWDASTGNGGVTWDFVPPPTPTPPLLLPTHLSLRVHNVFDGWDVGPPDCIATEEPLSFDVQVQDATSTGTARIAEVVTQDYSHAPPLAAGAPDACDNTQTLYTVRVPLSCLTTDTGSGIDAATLHSVQLRFGDGDASPEGAVVVDAIELTSSLEEPVPASCGQLESPAPAPLSGLAYTCVDYEPDNYVGFTEATNPGPGESLGELTFDGRFARFVAGRPNLLADCDQARYELDTVRADSDGDGTSNSTHDVRAIQSVDPTDLVALVGLEEGDSAITINEPGKPLSNAVELYDFGSFLAASDRFSALQNLEVRLLREQPSGLHEPVKIDAYVPADFTGVAAPQDPEGPSTYVLPTGATTVSTPADLVAELALPTGHDIVVADGDYTWTGPVTVSGPHRVWSENLLGAAIHFGLTYAGNANRTDGLELHGLAFELDDASMAPAGVGSTHVLFTWGQGGEDVLIEDCTFDGDLTIGDAIGAFAPNGLVVRRTEISNFWGYGLIVKQGAAGTVLGSEPLLEDLQIRSVFGANPGSSNGAWENGILLGNNGTIRRVDIRDVGWSAIQLYNDATGVSIEDVFIDYAGPGVWATAYTQARGAGIWLGQSHDVEIARVRIESHVFLGINVHWDQGSADPFLNTTPPRNHNITISDLYSRAYKIGVHLDLGVEDAVVRSSRFEHAWMAGVLDNNRFEDDWGWHPCPGGEEVCLQSLNRTEDIDCYLQDGAGCVAHHHNGGANATPPANWPSHPEDYLQPGGLWNRSNAAYPTEPAGGGDSSGGQADSSTSS